MRKVLALLAFVAPLAFQETAHADVALGTHFGAGVEFVERRTAHFFVGLPYSFGLPGLRFTAASESQKHEVYFDSSLDHSGSYTEHPDYHDVPTPNADKVVPSSTKFMVFIAYQHIFDPHQFNSLFFNVGGGPVIYSTEGSDVVTIMLGGGIGFRQRIAGGHGTFREELRLDFVVAHKQLPQAVILGFKLGWDLWFR